MRTSLKELVVLEGQGGQGLDLRLALPLLTVLLYGTARQWMSNESRGRRLAGRAMMLVYAKVMESLHKVFTKSRDDVDAGYLALHNAATAHGVLGNKERQNKLNRRILKDYDDNEQFADAQLVYLKAWFGLLENDPEFAATVEEGEWSANVERLADLQMADYPGRALRLAKYWIEQGAREAAEGLLREARDAEFGKQWQRQEVAAYWEHEFGRDEL